LAITKFPLRRDNTLFKSKQSTMTFGWIRRWTDPVPSFLPGPQEFWHKYQSAIDDTTAKDIVTVAAGPPVSNINFILNGTPPRFDSNEDGLISQGISQRPFLVCVIRRRWIFGASAGVSL